MNRDQHWQAIQVALSGQMTRATYDYLIASARLWSICGQTWVIGCPSPAQREWLEHRLAGVIQRTIEPHLGHPVRLVFRDEQTTQAVWTPVWVNCR